MHTKYDVNGNKVLVVTGHDLGVARGFSVQTLYNMPQTHTHGVGDHTETELRDYVKEYGTKRQKELFGII